LFSVPKEEEKEMSRGRTDGVTFKKEPYIKDSGPLRV
jgi:hypothetical protein